MNSLNWPSRNSSELGFDFEVLIANQLKGEGFDKDAS